MILHNSMVANFSNPRKGQGQKKSVTKLGPPDLVIYFL